MHKIQELIKSQDKMLKLSILCTRFESNCSSCTGRSSVKNICSSSGEAFRKKERQDETQFTTKIDGFLSFNPVLEC
jgi:hypothetical protein